MEYYVSFLYHFEWAAIARLFSKRVIEPELLDHAPAEEARLNLAQIVLLNERFGGHGVLRKILASVVNGKRAFTLLDVGSTSGRYGKSDCPALSHRPQSPVWISTE